jgi:fucokinase
LNNEISNALTANSTNNNEHFKFVKDEVIVELPARVNWGGGWSDTPPYCLENGGTVLNAAIKLNGECPIKVSVKRTDKRTICFKSDDLEYEIEYSNKESLLNLSNNNDPFLIRINRYGNNQK